VDRVIVASAKNFRSSTQSRHPLAPQYVSPKADYTPLRRFIRDHRPDALRGHFVSADAIAQYLLDGQQRTTALLTALHGGKIHG
jgi:streptomycin 6-kinase